MTLGPKWGRGHLPQDGPTPRTSWYYIVSDESQKRWPMYYNVVALHTHTHAQGGRPRPQSDKHQQNHAAAFEHKKNELSAAVVAGEMLNKYLGVYKQPYNSATCDWRAVRVGGNRLNNSEPFKVKGAASGISLAAATGTYTRRCHQRRMITDYSVVPQSVTGQEGKEMYALTR